MIKPHKYMNMHELVSSLFDSYMEEIIWITYRASNLHIPSSFHSSNYCLLTIKDMHKKREGWLPSHLFKCAMLLKHIQVANRNLFG